MELGSITSTAPHPQSENAALWRAAQAVEVSFMSEMLKSAGFGEVSDSFGGGVGEEQFSSFLVDAQSEQITRSHSLGIAEAVFRSLSEGVR